MGYVVPLIGSFLPLSVAFLPLSWSFLPLSLSSQIRLRLFHGDVQPQDMIEGAKMSYDIETNDRNGKTKAANV